MDIIIKKAKKTTNLYQIRLYDPDFCSICTWENVFFEDEATAEQYGKERYGDDFYDVVMKNGKQAPEGMVLYENANRPGDVFVCPKELQDEQLMLMREEGMAPIKSKTRWFPKDYSFATVTKENGELHWEWDD